MCRMIIACGEFSVADVIKAARAMAAGEIIKHDGSIKQHPDGWGCLWISNGQVRVGYCTVTIILLKLLRG